MDSAVQPQVCPLAPVHPKAASQLLALAAPECLVEWVNTAACAQVGSLRFRQRAMTASRRYWKSLVLILAISSPRYDLEKCHPTVHC